MYILTFPSETLRTNNAQSLGGSNATLRVRDPCVARVFRHFLVFLLLFQSRRPDFDVKGLHNDNRNDDLCDAAHRVTHYAIRSSNLQGDTRSAPPVHNTDFSFRSFHLLDGKYSCSTIGDTFITYQRLPRP